MGITKVQFLEAFGKYRGYKPYLDQEKAIFHDDGPLWVIAGPGTGKTEVLVLRTLRLLIMGDKKGPVDPESIVLTTFTEKAARQLYDRLSRHLNGIMQDDIFLNHYRKNKAPDLSRIWLGTLHSVSQKILMEMDEDSEDLEMLNDSASAFIFLQCIGNKISYGTAADRVFETVLGDGPGWRRRVQRAKLMLSAIQRVVEDNLDREKLKDFDLMRNQEKINWDEKAYQTFLNLLENYEEKLGGRVDFARIQEKILSFLESKKGKPFLYGEKALKLPGIKHVIVDEYQDTNPIQEAIYFSLAKNHKNIAVVGDDDQALYRFRGASVDSMVYFKDRCKTFLDIDKITMFELNENRRSHLGIVENLNFYLEKNKMHNKFKTARSDKLPLKALSTISGKHRSVVLLVRDKPEELADEVSNMIHDFYSEGYIRDLRQTALISPSTRVSRSSPFAYYHYSFEEKRLPLFNPRSKNFHLDPYLRGILGTLAIILDPNEKYTEKAGDGGRFAKTCRNALSRLDGSEELISWAYSKGRFFAAKEVLEKEEESGKYDESVYFENETLMSLLYQITGFEPYLTVMNQGGGPVEALTNWRVGVLTEMINGFEQTFFRPEIQRATDSGRQYFYRRKMEIPEDYGGIQPFFVDLFYRNLLGVFQAGGFDDVESEIEIFPPYHVPSLTIHQAKGLEFPIVFVTGLNKQFGSDASHYMEDFFSPAKKIPLDRKFERYERAVHDDIRKFFVAISRAKYSVVICLETKVYDGIMNGELSENYEYLPKKWLKELRVI